MTESKSMENGDDKNESGKAENTEIQNVFFTLHYRL
jgi:hypothetical protein